MTIRKRLVVVTGTYTDASGSERRRYTTVGHLHDGQYGPYITLDPRVSLAGLYVQRQTAGLNREGDDRLYVQLYDHEQGRVDGQQEAPQASHDPSDEVPF